MKKSPIIYLTTTISVAALVSSCALDPNYQEYKKQQAAAAAGAAANTDNPYGVPPSDGIPPVYTPTATDTAPYQPIPSVTQPSQPVYTPEASTITPNVSGSGSSYQVVAGDTLWDISRKFGSTVEGIQAANNLTTTTIRTGQTLIIPAR